MMPNLPSKDTLNLIVIGMMALLLLMLWVETFRRNRSSRAREENAHLKKQVQRAVSGLYAIRSLHPCDDPRCATNLAYQTMKVLYEKEVEFAKERPKDVRVGRGSDVSGQVLYEKEVEAAKAKERPKDVPDPRSLGRGSDVSGQRQASSS